MKSLLASNACQMAAPEGLPPEQMTPLQRADEIVSILVRALCRLHAAGDGLSETGLCLGFSAPKRGNTA